MSGLAVGLVLGIGLFCIWWSFWPRSQEEARASSHGPMAQLGDELVQADLASISAVQLIIGSVLLGLTVLVIGYGVTQAMPVALCFAVLAGMAPVALVRSRARRRRTSLREVWPEVVDNIASGVRAGLALPEALSQLAIRGPEQLRPAFAEFAGDYRATGRFNDCLDRLKDRLADPVGDRIVESLRIAREVGGSDLGRLLRTLSSFLRDDARTRAELQARQSWTVNAARLAVAAPWIVLGTMATRPDAVAAYRTAQGALILLFGAVMSIVAYRIMVQIGRLPEDQRVLR